jgi:hypothetical protein
MKKARNNEIVKRRLRAGASSAHQHAAREVLEQMLQLGGRRRRVRKKAGRFSLNIRPRKHLQMFL